MFEEIININFEDLKAIHFSNQVRQNKYSNYVNIIKIILDKYSELANFETLFNKNDRIFLKTDILELLDIFRKLINGEIKQIDGRLKAEKFNDKYIEKLEKLILNYSHFNLILDNKTKEFDNQVTEKVNMHNSVIKTKDENIENLLLEIKNLSESKIEELQKVEEKNNLIKSEKLHLESENERLQHEIDKKTLNKLATAFFDEEKKYKENGTVKIYFGFILLVIPSLFLIYVTIAEFINIDFFNKIELSKINPYMLIPFGILTIILWYLQYFQLKNYYINKDLETNFANRKAVANSFRGLLEMIKEEEGKLGDTSELTTKFLDKASDILYSEIDTSYFKKHDDNAPTGKVLDILQELIKKIPKNN